MRSVVLPGCCALLTLTACGDLDQFTPADGSSGEVDDTSTGLPIDSSSDDDGDTTTGDPDDSSDSSDSGSSGESTESGTDESSSDGGDCEDGETQPCACPNGRGTLTCEDGTFGPCECPPPACGDGVQDDGEECDDGNRDDTDDCTNACTAAVCGDSIVWAGQEDCDDGNEDDTDDCVACAAATCGDGFVWAGQEDCDDANEDDTDDCISCVAATCGDTIVWAGQEDCDDGNEDDTDDCIACVAATCGDGFLWDGVEACDDGNDITTDDCPACQFATCGDGYVHAEDEQCDDGNDDPFDHCYADCTPNICGDQIINVLAEQCDDGNDEYSDGCNPNCVISGSVDWYATYHNPDGLDSAATDVAVDSDGNTIAVGWEERPMLGQGAWMRKYGVHGEVLWTRTFDVSVDDDWIAGVDVTPADDIVVIGTFETGGGTDVFLRMYNPDGELIWSTTYGNPSGADDFGEDVDADDGFNVNVAITQERPDLGTGQDIMVRRYSGQGLPIWTDTISTLADERANGVDSAPAGNVIVVGYRETGADQAEFVTANYFPFGLLAWEENYVSGGGGYDTAQGVAVDDTGAAVVVGTEDRNDIGEGTEGRIIKYNASGGIAGTAPVGTGGDVDDEGWSSATGTDNAFWSAYVVDGPGGSQDAYVIRTSNTEGDLWSTYIDGPFGGRDVPAGLAAHFADYASVAGETETATGTDIFVARLVP